MHAMQVVAVVWRDPKVDQGNVFTREEILASKSPMFTTFGLLVRDDSEEVAIAAELCDDGNFRGVTHVMRPLVEAVIPITAWPKRQRKPRKEIANADVRDGSKAGQR